MDALGDELRVLIGGVFRGFGTSSLECDSVSLVLLALRSDKSLNFGRFGVWLGTFLLWCNFSSDHEFSGYELVSHLYHLFIP